MCKKIFVWSLIYQIAFLLFFSVIAVQVVVADESVTIEWDQNQPVPSKGYKVFQRSLPDGVFNYTTPVWSGIEITYTTPILPNGVYAWEVRASTDEGDSGSSNEVIYPVESPPDIIVYAHRPAAIRIKVTAPPPLPEED
ncbi:MAG: hypothetical protein JJV89_03015 [Desulfosarcina sp.]|nr:hypothetical protein [Desulfobacterales bacterium]